MFPNSCARKIFFSIAALIVILLSLTSCTLPRVREIVTTAPESPFPSTPEFIAVATKAGDTFSSLAEDYLGDSSLGWMISEFNGVNSLVPGQELLIPLKFYKKGGLNLDGYQTVPVLCYHNFSRTESDLMTVTQGDFEAQMKFLRDKGFTVISLDDLFDFFELRRQIPRKCVVITIDDGWRSVYEIAFPVLKKYNYPATLFLYTGIVVGSEKTLNWEMIRKMTKEGLDVQCHTKSHRSLIKKADRESFRDYFFSVQNELTESSKTIKHNLDTEVRYLAYPYGDNNHLIVALLRKLGYRGAFTVDRGGNPFFADEYRIQRSMVLGTFDLEDFERNLTVRSSKGLK